MPNYKEMYFKMVRESERAIQILIRAQQECEEMYLAGEDRGEEKPKFSEETPLTNRQNVI